MNIKPRTIFCHDNLPVLRGINSDSVDLIYLDPPFNKGRNFHAPIGTTAEGADFSDIWTPDSVKDEWHNLINDKHPKLYKYLDSVGDIGSRSAKYYLIYMAVRLMEIERILKPTGSVYLHCDPTAGHYLKLLMDTIFGHQNFRNEVVWKRTSAHSDTKRWNAVHDTLLFYSKKEPFVWNETYTAHDPQYVSQFYTKHDKRGRYRLHEIIRTASMGPRPNLSYEFKGYTPQWGWRVVREKLEALAADDRMWWSKTGRPYLKRYLHEQKGTPIRDVVTDINPIGAHAKERMGYPTQKPIALLDRIIKASSNKGDLVLDPFCGCATACVAAEKLQREWIGIDVSRKAYELVIERLNTEVPPDLFRGEPIFRSDIPTRTDIPYKKAPTQEDKKFLYGAQSGNCAGCNQHFVDIRHLEIDHYIPKSQGGSHVRDNLQLLCGHCNRTKGDRPMEYLIAKRKAFTY